MNDQEQSGFESELQRISPAAVPGPFLERLRAAAPEVVPDRQAEPWRGSVFQAWLHGLRWLVPAAPVAAAIVIFVQIERRGGGPATTGGSSGAGLLASDVRLDQNLVSSFDAVAELPGGEPVRFRCQEWLDQTVLSDHGRGMVIEQSRPRMEVVPVRFETY